MAGRSADLCEFQDSQKTRGEGIRAEFRRTKSPALPIVSACNSTSYLFHLDCLRQSGYLAQAVLEPEAVFPQLPSGRITGLCFSTWPHLFSFKTVVKYTKTYHISIFELCCLIALNTFHIIL